MVAVRISDEIKGVLERIGGMCAKSEAILHLCMEGFIKNKVSLVDDAKKTSQAIRNDGNELRKLLSSKAADTDVNKGLIKSLLSVINSIEMAVTGLDSIIQHVRFKVSEGILFSDKAVSEIRHLFKETLDILKTSADTVTTKNTVLRKYVNDKYTSLNEVVEAFAEVHEERLIKGLCQPQASPIYLNIVDAIMTIVWHVKQALNRLFESK
jgi:Na+/phosphate symporter